MGKLAIWFIMMAAFMFYAEDGTTLIIGFAIGFLGFLAMLPRGTKHDRSSDISAGSYGGDFGSGSDGGCGADDSGGVAAAVAAVTDRTNRQSLTVTRS